MDAEQMARWHSERETLFPTRIPQSAITVMNQQLPRLDAERASRALVSYSKQKPYKGFYFLKFMVHYERVGDGETPFASSRTDSAQERAAAAAANAEGEARHSQRREREAYAHLPPEFLRECETKYADYGWPVGSRGWMLLCLDAYIGRSVEDYRIHPSFASREYDRVQRMKAAAEEYARTRAVTIVERLRDQIRQLGGRVDVEV